MKFDPNQCAPFLCQAKHTCSDLHCENHPHGVVISMPKRKPLKRSRRSFGARVADAWHYWRPGMTLRNAWELAERVL